MTHVLPSSDVAHHLQSINLHIAAPESDVNLTLWFHEYNHVMGSVNISGLTYHVNLIKKKREANLTDITFRHIYNYCDRSFPWIGICNYNPTINYLFFAPLGMISHFCMCHVCTIIKMLWELHKCDLLAKLSLAIGYITNINKIML